MKIIRCCFVDFWPGFDQTIEYFDELYENYTILLDDKNPDYVIYSCFGEEHLKYNDRIKIYWTGENDVPDFNYCDYAIGCATLEYEDRYYRHHWGMYVGTQEYYSQSSPRSAEELVDRKFCNFVYANNSCADPIRERVFRALSGYKQIDAPGGFLNNMGKFRVSVGTSKRRFLSKYKFTLALENSSFPGYTTEKMIDPYIAHSLPIYWGNPQINKDYKAGSFINIMDYSSLEEAVEEIIRLDQDDAAYLEKLTAPFWPYGDSFDDFVSREREKYMHFFQSIFDQPLEQAMRRTRYGRAFLYMIPPPDVAPSFSRRVKNRIKRVIR